MKVVLQCVPERMQNIEKIQANFTKTKVELFCDHEKEGNFPTFLKIFNTECGDYRLYLQDDVILSPLFEDYLPELEKLMLNSGIDILSLFAPRNRFVHDQYGEGKTIGELTTLDWKPAFIVSPRANDLIRNYIVNYSDLEGDTMFMREFLRVHNIKPHVHLPSLVQHDLRIKSSMGHGHSVMRTTAIYDPDYIRTRLNGEPERERINPDIVKSNWKPYFVLYFLDKHFQHALKQKYPNEAENDYPSYVYE